MEFSIHVLCVHDDVWVPLVGCPTVAWLSFAEFGELEYMTDTLLAELVVIIYEGLYFDLAQGQMNGAPNETQTHSCRFASLTC